MVNNISHDKTFTTSFKLLVATRTTPFFAVVSIISVEGCSYHSFANNQSNIVYESMRHPTLQLTVAVDPADYHKINHPAPRVQPSKVTVVTDTGAESCLWGLSDFLRCGFSTYDLTPVKHTLYAANKEDIKVSGAILTRFSGNNNNIPETLP